MLTRRSGGENQEGEAGEGGAQWQAQKKDSRLDSVIAQMRNSSGIEAESNESRRRKEESSIRAVKPPARSIPSCSLDYATSISRLRLTGRN